MSSVICVERFYWLEENVFSLCEGLNRMSLKDFGIRLGVVWYMGGCVKIVLFLAGVMLLWGARFVLAGVMLFWGDRFVFSRSGVTLGG